MVKWQVPSSRTGWDFDVRSGLELWAAHAVCNREYVPADDLRSGFLNGLDSVGVNPLLLVTILVFCLGVLPTKTVLFFMIIREALYKLSLELN